MVEVKVEGHVEVEQFEMEILSREMTEIERTRQTIDDTRVVSTATKVKTNTQVHEYTDSWLYSGHYSRDQSETHTHSDIFSSLTSCC